jgi:drug/metabolite transporter (DMT)-like permease
VPWLGYAFAASGATLFAAKGIIIKLAYAEGVDALTLLALRMGMSLPVYVAVGLWTFSAGRRRYSGLGAKVWIGALLTGAVGYWFSAYADFRGLETLTPQFERLILFTYPLFVVLIGRVAFGLPARLKPLAAFAVSYAGLALIFVTDLRQTGPSVVAGTLWVVGAALTYALYQLLAKGGIAALGVSLFTSVAMAGAAAVVLVQFVATTPLAELDVSGRALVLSAILAGGATVAPAYLMSAALSRISAQANSTIGTMSPVVTLLLAVAILGEPLRLVDVGGTLMVITGLALFTYVERRG